MPPSNFPPNFPPMRNLRNYLTLLLVLGGLVACQKPVEDRSIVAAFDVYCEMVANDAKPMALHYPMDSTELNKWWTAFEQVAKRFNVKLYKETDFPITALFKPGLTKGKTVVLIYRGPRLKQYQQLKADIQAYKGNDAKQKIALARRFGRLLGYSPQGINALLSESSDYKNLASFDVQQQITHLYYEDLPKAIEFYTNTLGFAKTGSNRFQISEDAFIELHPLDENHPKDQVKSTAIAFLTDQLPEWYAHVQKKKVPIKYTYKPRKGGPHDGFVAIDPGGYLLEFEQFKQHPENELFMANLATAPRKNTSVKNLNFYGSITWTYHKDVLKMQNFYEQVLGYPLVADQGWTKIYQTSPTGFIGLVDERRGMEDYADTKAVEIEWQITNNGNFDTYARKFWQDYQYQQKSFVGPEKYRYRVK
ncbi:hypothetical protein BKI52_38825 [marine bacterium AO1-C]|nr:hypothetical protein BKI52_38825 [marine bacterium AO1-C]